MTTNDAVRFAIHIGSDIIRVVRQDDYDIAAAIAKVFAMLREENINVHMPSGRVNVTVERVR